MAELGGTGSGTCGLVTYILGRVFSGGGASTALARSTKAARICITI